MSYIPFPRKIEELKKYNFWNPYQEKTLFDEPLIHNSDYKNIINFIYEKQIQNKTNINSNIKINIYEPNYNKLNNNEKKNLNKLLQKYDKYFISKNRKYTLSELRQIDFNIKKGIRKFNNNNKNYLNSRNDNWLGLLNSDRYDKPIELFKRRQQGINKCIKNRKNNKQELDILTKMKNQIYINKNETKKEQIERLCTNVRWGPKDLIDNPKCNINPQKLLLDTFLTNKQIKNIQNHNSKINYNQKQYVFGFGEDVKDYVNCPRFFRSISMKLPPRGYDSSCHELVEWQPLLNKLFTYCSTKTELVFPIRFVTPRDYLDKLVDRIKFSKQNNFKWILRNMSFIGYITINFEDDRSTKKHKTEQLNILIFYDTRADNERYWTYDALHTEYTRFQFYDLLGHSIPQGLLFFQQNVTYDEINMFLCYLDMNIYWLPKTDIFLLTKYNKHHENIIKNLVIKYDLKNLTKYIRETLDPKGLKGCHMKQIGGNLINIGLEKRINQHDIELSGEFYKKFIELEIDFFKLFKKNSHDYLNFIFYFNNYEFIDPQNRVLWDTSKIITKKVLNNKKQFKESRKYKIDQLQDPNQPYFSIIKYKPLTNKFFNVWEEIYKFDIIKRENLKLLELTNNPTYLEACYYYDKKFKKTESEYNLTYFTNYDYKISKQKFQEKMEYIAYYSQYIPIKHTIFEKFINQDFITGNEQNKYDVIFSNLSVFIGDVYLYETHFNTRINFYIFLYSLLHLNKNGNLVINIKTCTTKAISDIVLMGKKFFKETHLYRPKVQNLFKIAGTSVIFKSFIGITKSIKDSMLKIFDKLYKYDESGFKFNILNKKNRNKYDVSSNNKNNFNYNYIKNFLNIDINNSKYDFIRDFNNNQYIQNVLYMKKLINNRIIQKKDPKKFKGLVNESRKEQIINAILWAKEFNLDYIDFDPRTFKNNFSKIIVEDMYNYDVPLCFQFKSVYNKMPKMLKHKSNKYDDFEKRIFLTHYLIDTRDILKYFKIGREILYYRPSNPEQQLIKILKKELNNPNLSQAWLKMYEILFKFKSLIPKNRKIFRTFQLCEAPGNFISAIDYYIQKETNVDEFIWNAQSLHPDLANIGDMYGYLKKYPNKWHFGKDGTGDITKSENIRSYKELCKNVDLMTSDCGIPKDPDNKDNEKLFYKLYFAEILFILYNLPKGKNFIAKVLAPMNKPCELSYLYILYQNFNKLYFYKPVVNQFSAEFYIIGIGYKLVDNKTLDKMFKLLDNFDYNKSLFNSYPEHFLSQYESFIGKIVNNYIFNIERKIFYVDNYDKIDKMHLNKIKFYITERNKDWIEKHNL